ncbi:MAG: YlxR family protein [Lachnospiraceae bacterium]|nr:YlxR family protein [Lachnospiraceae bacterium]
MKAEKPEARVFHRQCCACGARRQKAELLRIVRFNDGSVRLDPSGKQDGRGAWICREPECIRKAVKKHSPARVLKTEVPAEVYAQLEDMIEAG